MSAPCANRVSTTSLFPRATALYSAVLPLSTAAFMFAPLANRISTVLLCSRSAAEINGVSPSCRFGSTSAPLDRRSFMTSSRPAHAAANSAVLPPLSFALTFAPCAIFELRHVHLLTCLAIKQRKTFRGRFLERVAQNLHVVLGNACVGTKQLAKAEINAHGRSGIAGRWLGQSGEARGKRCNNGEKKIWQLHILLNLVGKVVFDKTVFHSDFISAKAIDFSLVSGEDNGSD